MKRANLLILLPSLVTMSCGVKGAPMPRRDEVFIEKTLIQTQDAEKKKAEDKTTILPKKDPR